LHELGRIIEAEVVRRGSHLLQLEAVVSTGTAPSGSGAMGSEVGGLFGGRTDLVPRAGLGVLEEQEGVGVQGQGRALIIGLPNVDPYSQHAGINPLLITNLGCAYTFGLYQNRPLLREGGVLMLCTPMEPEFDDLHHPSYREFYERVLRYTLDPTEAW